MQFENRYFQEMTFSEKIMIEKNFTWIFTTGADDEDLTQIISNDLYQVTNNGFIDLLNFKYSSKDYDGNYRCLIVGKTDDGDAVYGVRSAFSVLFVFCFVFFFSNPVNSHFLCNY